MSELRDLCAAASVWADQPMALATVVSTWGSAPRPKGSHMLMAADGGLFGSVSGGCVEAEVIALGEAVMAGRSPPALRHYGVANADAWEVGLPCGGEISVLVQPVNEQGFAPALFEAIAAGQEGRETVAISTDLDTGRSTIGTLAGRFVNLYRPPRRLLIVGAVQIAQSLAVLARSLGIDVVVNDPRGRFLTADRFPDVMLDDRWPDEAVTAFAPDGQSGVVTLSHDIKIDDPALSAALALPTAYVAALGSRKSHAARLDRLRDLGVAEADLDRIEGPAGLAIGAIGSAEIALSILASLVARLNGQP